jgi:enamine deaminase RidA (YjgF/YER057c/UK114 family)
MTSPSERLLQLGIELPRLSDPAGNYVHAVRAGSLLFLAGKGIGDVTGKVGLDLTVADAYACARSTGLLLLAAAAAELGSLDRIARVVKVNGYVNATPDFVDHPRVIDGCSDLFVEVFGDAGRHARTSLGVGSTPSQIPIEIEVVLEFRDG